MTFAQMDKLASNRWNYCASRRFNFSYFSLFILYRHQVRINRDYFNRNQILNTYLRFEKTKKSFKKFDYKSFGNQFVVSEPYKGHFWDNVFTSDINTSPEQLIVPVILLYLL